MSEHSCANPASWHPTLHHSHRHHSPPRSWTTDGGASSTIVRLCGLCHEEVHELLNDYVRAGRRPPWSVRRSYGPFIRDLAQHSWDARIEGRTPYTTGHGVV